MNGEMVDSLRSSGPTIAPSARSPRWGENGFVVLIGPHYRAFGAFSPLGRKRIRCAHQSKLEFLPCFLEIASILRQKTAKNPNGYGKAEWNTGSHFPKKVSYQYLSN
jgi:hypothetical protein